MALHQPSLFIPHGGGPCFFMPPRPGHPPDLWDRMAAFLRGIAASLPERPRAVLVISGHWEEPAPAVNGAAHPGLLFDYYGFPAHTYQLTYPVPGDAVLAAEVRSMLETAGFVTGEDDQRGLDHGVFVPFKLVFPDADIPLVQLSLIKGLDPAAHIAMGRALAPLRNQGVLIVGSGMSYHNLRHIYGAEAEENAASAAFDEWLEAAVTGPDRDAALAQWAQAQGARQSHPREEHLIPLMVAAGAGGSDPGVRVYKDELLGKTYAGYRFG